MAKFLEAQRGYINLDLVAFLFRKEDGDYVAYSAEGNEIGTIGTPIVDRVISGPATQPDDERDLAAKHKAALRKILAANNAI